MKMTNVGSDVQYGIQHCQCGEWALAIPFLRKAMARKPHDKNLLYLLCRAMAESGQPDQSVAELDRRIRKKPKDTFLLNLKGDILKASGHLTDAKECFTRSLRINANQKDVLESLLTIFGETKAFAEARGVCQQLKERFNQNSVDFVYRCGYIEEHMENHEAAIAAYVDVLERDPGQGHCRARLYKLLHSLCFFAQADALFEAGVNIALQPDGVVIHPLLFDAYLNPHLSDQEVFALHQKADRQSRRPVAQHCTPAPRVCTPQDRLRVGFISGDFKRHPVSTFMLPLAEALRDLHIDSHAFANVAEPDAVTQKAVGCFHQWHDISRLSDPDAAQLIARQNLDILVDLSGHTQENRIHVLQWRPAPIQCTYMGYIGSTGFQSIDYWILDPFVFPETSPDPVTEQIYRIDRPWMAFPPNDAVPEPLPKAAKPNAPIVFGTANLIKKYSAAAIRLFAMVLLRVPNSILLLKSPGFESPAIVEAFTAAFAQFNIPSARLRLIPFSPSFADHIRTVQHIDIALDTTPFSGATTTCETLWAGVPVLSLTGPRYVNRMSAAMLAWLGLHQWICQSEDEFVTKAHLFALDRDGLNEFRCSIRERMRSNPLTNVNDLAHHLHFAFRDMMMIRK